MTVTVIRVVRSKCVPAVAGIHAGQAFFIHGVEHVEPARLIDG